MQKPKLALILATVQFVLAAILLQLGYRAAVPHGVELYVPTARLICLGINAPARLFRFLDPTGWGENFDFLPRKIFGFGTDDLFFLAGVILVWCLVGRAMDQKRALRTTRGSIGPAIDILLLTVGFILLFGGRQEMMYPRNDNPKYIVSAILTLIWSFVLIFLSGRALMRRLSKLFFGQPSERSAR